MRVVKNNAIMPDMIVSVEPGGGVVIFDKEEFCSLLQGGTVASKGTDAQGEFTIRASLKHHHDRHPFLRLAEKSIRDKQYYGYRRFVIKPSRLGFHVCIGRNILGIGKDSLNDTLHAIDEYCRSRGKESFTVPPLG